MPDDQPPQHQQRISLAELLEVRNAGLSAQEVLTMLATSCEHLVRAANRRGLFTIEQIYLTNDGRVEVQLIPIADVPKQLIPPELIDQSQPFGPGNADSHLVWCLGTSCAQASAADHSDIALFSLLNLMTVAHVQSRPSLQKVRQMIRNRLNVVEVDRMPDVVSSLFREVMGDLDELITDPFGDDIRFHSSRSSQLSIIPGPGAPEHRERRDLEAYQQELASEVADRLRRDFSLSRKHSNKDGEEGEKQFDDEAVNIPDQLRHHNEKPVPSPRRVISPIVKKVEDTEEEEELTPRGPSPTIEEASGKKAREEEEMFVPIQKEILGGRKEGEKRIGGNTNPFFNESDEEEEGGATTVHPENGLMRPNAESIQVEVHSSAEHSPAIAHQQKLSSSSGQSPSSQPKSARLYAKAAHTTGANKVARAATAAKKVPEIEIVPAEQDQKQQVVDTYEDEDITDTAAAAATLPTSVASGFSPGTRRRQMLPSNNKLEEERPEETEEGQRQQFHRQNSLQAGRCSRRASSGGRTAATPGPGGGGPRSYSKLPAVPEFLSNNARPNIRLRAQSMKKKKVMVTLHRAEPAVVFVRLLDGHSVEVNCKTNQLVGAVFHTVAEHLDITEHIFFGLVLQQAHGESLFLEEEQRLEKWAPPGWKNGTGLRTSFGAGGTLPRSPLPPTGEQFILHLRFRYYPKKREFVKTAITAHQLYLQLRQDMLNGTLRFQPREQAIEMAALALCVECGRPPAVAGDYFKLENYLPSKFYELESGEILQVHREIGAVHARIAEHFGRLEAEERFIQLCQAEPYYGAHFYRAHKMKPKRGQQPFFSDMRSVAVMPSGIGICREERGGTRRLFTSLHEWHQIRTLQFDRKRFLLGTVENGIAVDHVFYTDHHSKSAYLVRFAASQHRFMLKMRQWQGTLNRMRAMQRHKDVGVEVGGGHDENGQQQQRAQTDSTRQHRRNGSQPQMGVGGQMKREESGGGVAGGNNDLGGTERRQSRLLAETDKEYIQYCYGPDAQRVDVVLEKHPEFGLGLTLVDGAVNGVKGVYVKSLNAEGDGRRKGLLIGDCLLSINGTSLFNRTRHDAVELVRECGREVRLEILRFPSISEVLAQEPLQSVLSAINGKVTDPSAHKKTSEKQEGPAIAEKPPQPISARRRTSSSFLEDETNGVKSADKIDKRKESTLTTQSRTSAESGGGTPQSVPSGSAAQHRRQRAVSDFGAFGGTLPALRTDDILAAAITTPHGGTRKDEHRAMRYRRHKTSAGFPERTSDSEVDSTDSESESTLGNTTASTNGGAASSAQCGEYRPAKQQLPPVSAMYRALEDEEEEEEQSEDESHERGNQKFAGQKPAQNNAGPTTSPYALNNNNNNVSIGRSPFAAAVERYARLDTSNGNTSQDSWGNAKRNNLDWTNDISDFESSKSPFNSSQQMSAEQDEEILMITLDKTGTSPIGLSLAKRMGYEGVFVRNIAQGSLAAQEGTLRIGDRIWRILDEELSPDESPASVVKKLKEMEGQLHIQVKRKRALE